ncbi:Membrane carboxypeptidase (penicillin-binding protein) [Microbacterium sp. cf046]|uniref:transglycosylase domain-containing protein n=1 Tax=Microbacterium sp. cf046 TaxID=1761803 RepID=UPI0008E21E7F|nr:transglycosylase domain-containing protein [Microbacterium sp. cf046]SFS16372.1 Membrane carboxypeptidase (penicillin-binding protein) [Microbacterium sp. cf046]
MPDTKRTASGVFGGLLGLVGLSAAAGVLITATVTPAIALTGAAATSAITMFDNLPSVLDIDKLMLPTTLYAKNPDTGEDVELAQFYDQNRSPVDFDEVNPVMYDAILSSEDPRFYQHGGVDLIGTSRAIVQNVQGGGETQGGSSISQQYVKNILIQRCERDAATSEELLNCWTEATTAAGTEGIQRKLQEMRYAIALEQKYSKNDILLGYLNIANFGGQTYGIDAAARYYFGVAAKDLTLAQAATLAGIVQNPNTYRIDKPAGSIFDADGLGYNKAPDGLVDDVNPGQLAALDTLLSDGTITQEQYLAAADGYSATKGRQLYVLSRLLDDGKITQEQYTAAAIEPITPVITPATTGCAAAGGAAYFCQYVKNIIKSDPAFGATPEDRIRALQRGGLNVYTTMDYRIQVPADQAMHEWAPTSVEGMVDGNTGKFGSSAISIEASTGRILAISQNTIFSEDATLANDPNYSSLVYAADYKYGNSTGFPAGSTFKLFTLIDWLEKGHSVNEVLNGRVRVIDRMTNSCTGDWVNTTNDKIGNFGGGGGYTGTPMEFTAQSLNSGYFAMAEELDLCDIQKVATKMGVMRGDGVPVTMDTQFSVIGSNNVAPMAMAGAYATVANNGIYCQPKAIDRVTDSDGNEITPPQTTCTQVLDPTVAATAAYALQGVMRSGGTGSASNPDDGTPLIGKTGTHEEYQTWMVESSTKVATAVWVGNSIGEGDIFQRYFNDVQMSQLRHQIAPRIQRAADAVYGGDQFPEADSNLTRQVLRDLPNVIGMTVDQATATLDQAGFNVTVGDPVDSAEAEGIVAAQNPGAGLVGGGTDVTINPSNGQGIAVPDVAGKQLDKAISDLRGAGFGNVKPGTCTEDDDAGAQGKATGTSPGAGSVVNRNSAITVNYSRTKCT